MASISQPSVRQAQAGHPPHTSRFDAIMGVLTIVLMTGLFIDGWAHNHGRVDESFFTPYHAVMYSSYAIFGAILLGTQYLNVNRGYHFLRALPKGYFISVIGIFIFGIGGFGDMLWHEAFGIEEGLEALYSPTHLILAVGYTTVIGGVIYSAWTRPIVQRGWPDLWWVILASFSFLNILTFMVQHLTFLRRADELLGRYPFSTADLITQATLTSFIVVTALMTGLVLMLARRWQLPLGTVTVMLTLNAIFMGVMLLFDTRGFRMDDFLPIMALNAIPVFISGLIIDGLIWRLRATPHTPNTMRVIGFVMPFTIALTYILGIAIMGAVQDETLWWEIHTWLGIPTLCGLAGLMLSLLTFPPAVPNPEIDA